MKPGNTLVITVMALLGLISFSRFNTRPITTAVSTEPQVIPVEITKLQSNLEELDKQVVVLAAKVASIAPIKPKSLPSVKQATVQKPRCWVCRDTGITTMKQVCQYCKAGQPKQ